MATLGFTNVSTTIAPSGLVPLADETGLYVEVFKVAVGSATAGDTMVIVPALIGDIRYVKGEIPASNNLSTSAANTNVTLTVGVTYATDATASYMVEVVGRRAT